MLPQRRDRKQSGPVTVLWDKLLGQTETAAEALKIAQPEIQSHLDQYWADRA